MMKLSLVFTLFPIIVSGFRAPENGHMNVKLPDIKKASPQKAALIAPKPPKEETANIVDAKTPDSVLAQQLRAVTYKRWGIDNENDLEYWNDSRIHTLGNIGFWGAVHAIMAPLSTKMIDVVAYNGTDVRYLVAEELSKKVKSSKARVADLCCGVGFSTRALRKAFPEAETVLGMDTSPEMIEMAKFVTNHLAFLKPIVKFFNERMAFDCTGAKATTFETGNAECTGLTGRSFDLVTIMYAFHEAPRAGRERILQEAYRILQPGGMVAVLDISTEYTPSRGMLAGEPYVLEYQKNIHSQLKSMRGFDKVTYKTIVPNHVGMWMLRRSGPGYASTSSWA